MILARSAAPTLAAVAELGVAARLGAAKKPPATAPTLATAPILSTSRRLNDINLTACILLVVHIREYLHPHEQRQLTTIRQGCQRQIFVHGYEQMSRIRTDPADGIAFRLRACESECQSSGNETRRLAPCGRSTGSPCTFLARSAASCSGTTWASSPAYLCSSRRTGT